MDGPNSFRTADISTPLSVVDFHNHFIGSSIELTTLVGLPAPQRAFWEAVNRQLVDDDALIRSVDAGGVDARAISAPIEFVAGPDGTASLDLIRRMNDTIAGVAARHPGRIYGLATVDAYGGEAAARELTRAVRELGLRGVFVESAKGELLPDAPQARPAFEAAAALGIPVFLHPVEDPQLFQRFKKYGRLGVRLTRGTINGAALFAMLESGMFEEIANLRVVVTALALGGLLLAGSVGDGWRLRKDTPPALRRHVYADTTGVHPAVIRAAVDLLGADHVLFGSDWPVVSEVSVRDALQTAFGACGIDAAAGRMIAGENARQLMRG